MTLQQSVGVILGANIGTTITAQILRLDSGAALGGSFFLGMAAGTCGLCRTSTTTASLLENTSIILVPPPSGEQCCGWRWYAAASALFCSLWRKGTFPPSEPPFSLR